MSIHEGERSQQSEGFAARPAGTKEKVLAILQQLQEKHPDRVIVLKEIGKMVGVSGQAIGKIYGILTQEGHDLPPKRVGTAKDAVVKVSLDQGLTVRETAEKHGIPIRSTTRSRARLIKEGKYEQKPSIYEVLDPYIVYFRSQGLGNEDSAERIGTSKRFVDNRLKRLVPAGKAARLRETRINS